MRAGVGGGRGAERRGRTDFGIDGIGSTRRGTDPKLEEETVVGWYYGTEGFGKGSRGGGKKLRGGYLRNNHRGRSLSRVTPGEGNPTVIRYSVLAPGRMYRSELISPT